MIIFTFVFLFHFFFQTNNSQESRIAMIHSLANIEQWAIDLSWDIIGRFSPVAIGNKKLPTEFYDDFLKVADDEAKVSETFIVIREVTQRDRRTYSAAAPIFSRLKYRFSQSSAIPAFSTCRFYKLCMQENLCFYKDRFSRLIMK